MGINYLRLYQLLHANEKPMKFSEIKNYEQTGFANTELILEYNNDLKKEQLIYSRKNKIKSNDKEHEKKAGKMVTLQKDL